MIVIELPCPLESKMTEVVVAKLPCPLETMEVAVVELLSPYDKMAVVELLVDRRSGKCMVHG
jgi:hypothetical protein